MKLLRFLLLENNLRDADVIKATLVDGAIDCELLRVETRCDFVAAFDSNTFDLILASDTVPDLDGLSAKEIALNFNPDVPFIFVSSNLSEELEITALKSGATDYVLKQRLGRLVPSVQRALHLGAYRGEHKLERANEELQLILEELQVAEEELRQQNQELAIAQEAIETEKQRYQDLFNFAPSGYIVTDAVGKITEANWQIASLVGHDPNYLVGVPLVVYVSEADSRAFRNLFYDLRHQHQLQTDEISLKPPGKNPIPVNITVIAVRDAIGQVVGARWIIRDITERKRDELNAKFLDNISQDLVGINNVNEIVQLVGKELNIYLNTSRCIFNEINLAADETINEHNWHQDDVASVAGVYRISEFVTAEFLTDAVAGKPVVVRNVYTDARIADPQRYEKLNIGAELNIPLIRDGEWKFSLTVFHSQPYNWRQDEIKLMQELANRIFQKLERTRTEEALRESEEKYRTLFESIDQGFCICEMLFDENNKPDDYRVLIINPAYETMTGLREATGKTARLLVPNLEAFWFETYGRVVQTGKPVRFQNQSIAMNRWFDVNAFSIGEAQSNKFAVLFTDITARKKIEQEREQFLAVGSDLQFIAGMDGYFKWVSPSFEQRLGWTAEEMICQPWTYFIHPSHISTTVAETESVFLGNELIAFENRYRHKNGSYRWLLWKAQPYPSEQIVYGVAVDITERKIAEVALAESEEQSRNILESIKDGFFALDFNWRFTYINQAAEHLLDFSTGAKLGKNFWESFPGLADTEFGQLHHRVMHNREAESRTAFYPNHNRWYEVSSYPAKNGITIYFRNITDTKQAEEALRLSESRFRLMVESAKEYAIFTLDLQGTISSWNSGAERLLGYTETEALGCSGRMIFTPEDKELQKPEQEMQLALEEGRGENERWHVRSDGSRFWGSGLMMPLLSETGNVQGFIKIMQDKTAQQQADMRLHLLYETTRDLLATEQPMQLMSNLFNKLSAQLELHYYFNYMVEKKANCSMLHLRNYGGISPEAAQSIEWIELYEHICGLVATEKRQIVFDKAQISTHPNAQLVKSMGVTAYAAQPLIAHGRFLGTFSFASCTRTSFTPEEIDLLQSACEQMAIAIERANLIASIQQQAEQLKQANRIKDEFLAVLSHELRSPLNPILGWSKMLQTGKLDKAKTAQGLATIERNAKLQSELIEDLLDVSRILQGKLALNVRSLDLAPTIQAAMETVQLAAQAKSIQIHALLESNVEQVSGDANRLQQIVWNLLSNAVKFTSQGGQVNIELRRLNNTAQIIVSDNGIGIKPEFLPHVFDYFRQEDGSTTRRFGGLGLGLAIVRHLVELHGGTVGVKSLGEGQGSTFTVTLPLVPNSIETNIDNKQPESSLNLEGIKVLVVDDDTDTREFITFMLSMYGASVTAVDSGAEALANFAQHKPDILVSDIGMPDIDGYMLIQQLRALGSEQGGLLPAIALTAFAGEINQQQALKAGFQRHISKPIEPATLITAIAELIGAVTLHMSNMEY